MNNQITTPSKINPNKKAVASLVVGIISVLGGIGAIYIYGSYDWGGIILIIYLLFPMAGLFFGKIGISSTKKGLAIVGIILSIIGLVGTISFYLFIKGVAESM